MALLPTHLVFLPRRTARLSRLQISLCLHPPWVFFPLLLKNSIIVLSCPFSHFWLFYIYSRPQEQRRPLLLVPTHPAQVAQALAVVLSQQIQALNRQLLARWAFLQYSMHLVLECWQELLSYTNVLFSFLLTILYDICIKVVCCLSSTFLYIIYFGIDLFFLQQFA